MAIKTYFSAALGAFLVGALSFGASALGQEQDQSSIPFGERVDAPVVEEEEYGKPGEYSFPSQLSPAGAFATFEPKPNGRTTNIDYSILSEALDIMVFRTGPSLRVVARPRKPPTGSRFVKGHKSPLRLEGNKIFFSQFDNETRASFTQYKDSLVEIAERIDISTLRRNEQLAYWYNLHNVLVIESIVTRYPVKVPERIKIGPNKLPLHEAKLVTIRGVPLSLNDIRRNIVYRYWDDPRVLYGFFHGDLGSPNINSDAFTAGNLGNILDANAYEFVNSLRGVASGRNTIYISKHYLEARAGLFPNWPTDLSDHLFAYAKEEVKLVLNKHDSYTGNQYEPRTADMVGGDPRLDILAGTSNLSMPPQMAELTVEIGEKLVELRRKGKLRTRVIIVDLPDDIDDLDDLDDDEEEELE